jgi:ribose-phosphate pyrophosphokinase
MAARLRTPLAIVEKRRVGNVDKTETLGVIGDVKEKCALLFDDEIDTGGSITSAAKLLKEQGAKEVYACCTHPIFSGPAIERLAASHLKEVVVTDSVPVSPQKVNGKITVLSLAPMIGEAIQRIHKGISVGAMFEQI